MLLLPEPYAAQAQHLIAELSEAVHDAGVARRAVEVEEAYQQKIASRVAELAEQRGNIIARRSSGAHEGVDAADLVLIAADLEGLQPLLQEAAGKVAETQRAHSAHTARASGLRQQLAELQALTKRDALVAYLATLGEKMQEGLAGLDEAVQVTGYTGKPLWSPPAPLYAALRKLAAQSGLL